MKEEDEECLKNINICQFCENNIESNKIRDNCHLTGKYRGPTHSKCNINVFEDQSNIILFVFHSFSNYDCHIFF